MKVADTSQIKALAPGKTPEPGRTNAERQSGDRVTTEETAKIASAISAAAQSAGTGHAAKLAAIEAAVKQGTYRPNPQQIAEQILDDAVLAARLQALFRK